MERSVNDEKTKALIKEVMVELLQQRKGVFYEIVLEALEEIAIGEAIQEGRKNEFVDENTIMDILEGHLED